MARRVVVYNDFSFGDFGRLGPSRAPKGSWTGSNMLVYRTGEIGVRAGLREVTPSSGHVTGEVWALSPYGSLGNSFWYGVDDDVYWWSSLAGGGAATDFGTLTGNPGGPDDVDVAYYGDDTYIITETRGGYRIAAGVFSAMTGCPNGYSIALVGDRVVISAITTPASLRYSAAANPNSWPATNSITVGGNDIATTVRNQRGHLVIFKNDAGYYIMSGVPGVNETLRKALSDMGPGTASGVGTTRGGDRIWYVCEQEQTPIMFDGSKTQRAEHILLPNTGSPHSWVTPLPTGDPDSFALRVQADDELSTDPCIWLYLRGAWTKHTFGVAVNGPMAASSFSYFGDPSTSTDDDSVAQSPYLVINDGVTSGTASNFYSWMVDMDRPGSETDTFSISHERAGDNSTAQVSGNFSLPEWWSDEGSEVQVRGVIVDFRTWNTGGSLTNHFDLEVDNFRPYNGSGAIESLTQSWDEAGSLASTGGSYRRQAFSFGDSGYGNGFQLHFTNCRGIAIRRIEVVIDSTPPRGF